jgi:hypothetical protein
MRNQIDSASMHAVVSGLVRKGEGDWTDWEARAIAEVTLSLLYRVNVSIPPPPRRQRTLKFAPPITPVDRILDILRDFVSNAAVSARDQKRALTATKDWINEDPRQDCGGVQIDEEEP